METKKYVVSYFFTSEFESTSDSLALGQAAARLQTGFAQTRKLTLTVIAAIPLITPREPAPELIVGMDMARAPELEEKQNAGESK